MIFNRLGKGAARTSTTKIIVPVMLEHPKFTETGDKPFCPV